MQQFVSTLHEAEFRAQVAQLPGYDPTEAGRTEPARSAFPAPPRTKRRSTATV
jgi:hypothetical protein